MEKNSKSLFYFTISYPFGTGETFIQNELNIISKKFDKIFIFPKNTNGHQRTIPKNSEIIVLTQINKKYKWSVLRKEPVLLIYLIINEVISRQRSLFFKNLRYNLNYIINCIHFSNQIQHFILKENLSNTVYYSYWFYDWNASLAILKYKKTINNFLSRAHGFDLYEFTWKNNYLPLRKFCLNFTDKVICISKTGSNYLGTIYPNFKNKINVSYLGTLDHGINPLPKSNSPLILVSCSNLAPVKRAHLIIEILKQMKEDVIWSHVGDGPLRQELEQIAGELPANIKVEFKGLMTQEELFNFYSNNAIHLFINCSISEGLPVSIMEAISFGIPVIATDVGGTHEIVNAETGRLIGSDFVPAEVANKIKDLVYSNGYVTLRNSSKRFWQQNFSAEDNYEKFYNYFLR